MAMDASQLAEAITLGINQSLPPSTEVEGFAQGVINALQGATATFGPPSGNTISGIVGAAVAADVQAGAGYPGISSELSGFGSGLASYVQANAIVTYTGPGPSFFTGGTISGLVGAAFASVLQGSMGYPSVSSELLGMATAITDHIVANAEVESGVIS